MHVCCLFDGLIILKVVHRGHISVICYNNPLPVSWVNLINSDDMIMKQRWWLRLTNTWKRLSKHLSSKFNSFHPTAQLLSKLIAHYANGGSGAKHSKCLVSPTWKIPRSRSWPLLLLSILWIVKHTPFEAVYFLIPFLCLNDSYLMIIPSWLWNTTIPVTIPKNAWSIHSLFKHTFNDGNITSPTVTTLLNWQVLVWR